MATAVSESNTSQPKGDEPIERANTEEEEEVDEEFREEQRKLELRAKLRRAIRTVISINAVNDSFEERAKRIATAKASGSLDLSGMRRTFLPDQVFRLKELRTISLNRNHLAGLPRELERCRELREISVRLNYLEDFPPVLTTLTKLELFDANGNGITNIPSFIGCCTSLTKLALAANRLTSISPNVGDLVNLNTLDIAHNKALRTIPFTLAQIQSSLTILDLRGCEGLEYPPPLESHLKRGSTALTKAEVPPKGTEGDDASFEVDSGDDSDHEQSRLVGRSGNKRVENEERDSDVNVDSLESLKRDTEDIFSIFLTTANAKETHKLSYSGVRINQLPPIGDQLPYLTDLDLSGCGLRYITETLFAMPILRVLNLSNNRLSTLQPLRLSSDKNASDEVAEPLRETGPEGDSWEVFSHLKVLDLSNNELTELPDTLRLLTSLVSLDFARNPIKRMPDICFSMKRLRIFSAGGSILMEEPPKRIINLQDLRILRMPHCGIRLLPSVLYSLTLLQELNLEHNRLSSIDNDIGRLQHLRSLALSHNNLSSLPNTLAFLTSLETAYFEGNKLEKMPHLRCCGVLQELVVRDNRISRLQNSSFSLHMILSGASDGREEGREKVVTAMTTTTTTTKGGEATAWKWKELDVEVAASLTRLSLDGNRIAAVPALLFNVTTLTELSMKKNCISSLSFKIGSLTQLRSLCLSDNRLENLPPDIGRLELCTFLSVNENDLLALPAEIDFMTSLRTLQLAKNRLSILPPMPHLAKLEHLDVSSNSVSVLSENHLRLDSLKVLLAANNCLAFVRSPFDEGGEGAIWRRKGGRRSPKDEGEGEGESKVDWRHAEKEKVLSSLSPLEVIDLSGNAFRELPKTLLSLSRCSVLDLRRNRFLHSLPLSLPWEPLCSSLKTVFLDEDALLSPPAEVSRRGAKVIMRYLRRVKRAMDARVGEELRRPQKSVTFDLRHFGLTSIPSDVLRMEHLQVLQASHNKLSALPTAISRLQKLEEVYLDCNAFSVFPHVLLDEALLQLQIVSLRHNRISSLPLHLAVRHFRVLSLEGNPLRSVPNRVVAPVEASKGKRRLLRRVRSTALKGGAVENEAPVEHPAVHAASSRPIAVSKSLLSYFQYNFDYDGEAMATVSPAHCLVDGPGLEDGEASASSRIEVTLCDGEGRELSASITSAVVEAEVFSSGAIVTVVGRPDGDGATAKGRVGLSYPRETAGVSTVIVRVNGEPIGGSPFHVATTAGPVSLRTSSLSVHTELERDDVLDIIEGLRCQRIDETKKGDRETFERLLSSAEGQPAIAVVELRDAFGNEKAFDTVDQLPSIRFLLNYVPTSSMMVLPEPEQGRYLLLFGAIGIEAVGALSAGQHVVGSPCILGPSHRKMRRKASEKSERPPIRHRAPSSNWEEILRERSASKEQLFVDAVSDVAPSRSLPTEKEGEKGERERGRGGKEGRQTTSRRVSSPLSALPSLSIVERQPSRQPSPIASHPLYSESPPTFLRQSPSVKLEREKAAALTSLRLRDRRQTTLSTTEEREEEEEREGEEEEGERGNRTQSLITQSFVPIQSDDEERKSRLSPEKQRQLSAIKRNLASLGVAINNSQSSAELVAIAKDTIAKLQKDSADEESTSHSEGDSDEDDDDDDGEESDSSSDDERRQKKDRRRRRHSKTAAEKEGEEGEEGETKATKTFEELVASGEALEGMVGKVIETQNFDKPQLKREPSRSGGFFGGKSKKNLLSSTRKPHSALKKTA